MAGRALGLNKRPIRLFDWMESGNVVEAIKRGGFFDAVKSSLVATIDDDVLCCPLLSVSVAMCPWMFTVLRVQGTISTTTNAVEQFVGEFLENCKAKPRKELISEVHTLLKASGEATFLMSGQESSTP